MEKNVRLVNLGLNIKAERVRKQLSQEQLAELIETSRNTISMFETARVHATVLKIVDIVRVLNVNINDLLKDI